MRVSLQTLPHSGANMLEHSFIWVGVPVTKANKHTDAEVIEIYCQPTRMSWAPGLYFAD